MSAERLSPESSLQGLFSQLVFTLVSPTRTMRTISLLATFIFLGIATAKAIPEAAALDDIVPDGQGDYSLGLPTTTTLAHIPRGTDTPDVAEHTKHSDKHSRGDSHHHTKSSKKGKHSHSMTSQGAKPTKVVA